ncbi:peptidase [Aureimonas endophytica]|uniref:Peptidase n=1 Tax=Aureimonas endophytica TaxID=2027858 RepID=A0A916ZF72_9HYPH|nr:DUF922 domain-containing protein [Aureimonas endophytica]GGD91271.1 peptidase [Aureimonas endophytica]
MQQLSLALLLAIGCVAGTVSARAGGINERTNYFTLRGATLEELDREMNRKGPTTGVGEGRHPGATQVKFGGSVSYKPVASGCAVGRVDFNLRLVKILPRWTPPKSASAGTVIVWRTLSEDIARHEEDHAKIARDYLRRMEAAVRNLGSRGDCRAMEQAVNATTGRYLKEHEAAQRAFDTMEGREVNWRLKRLLRRNMDAAMSAGGAGN